MADHSIGKGGKGRAIRIEGLPPTQQIAGEVLGIVRRVHSPDWLLVGQSPSVEVNVAHDAAVEAAVGLRFVHGEIAMSVVAGLVARSRLIGENSLMETKQAENGA